MIRLNQKIYANKTKHLLVENELKKVKKIDSDYFRGTSRFEEDGIQNYLVFHPMYRYFKSISSVRSRYYIHFWKCKGLSDENIMAPTKNGYRFNPQIIYLGTKTRLEFKENSLNQDKITYDNGKVVNI